MLQVLDATPDTFDPPPGTPGARKPGWTADNRLPGVSEFCPDELALILNCGRGTASRLASRAWTFRATLPATRTALAAGKLDEPRAKALAVLEHAAPHVARAIEAELLPAAAGLSRYELRNRALALLLERDAAAVDKRRTQAKKAADVRTYPSPLDGHATLAAELPAAEAAEAYDLLDQLARMLKADGDPRPIGQLRAEVLSALIRRPADHGLPQARAKLTVIAALAALAGTSTVAGEVNGHPITAAHLRELLARIGALGLSTPAGGALTVALTDPGGRLLATATPAALARLPRRGCPAHPAGACGCPTTCTNLCCMCRSHHRLKTFAGGWRFRMDPDGTLHVTTPSGVTRTTRPPGLHPPDEPPPEPEPGRPPAQPADDPPPF